MHATRSVHFIPLDLISVMISRKGYKI